MVILSNYSLEEGAAAAERIRRSISDIRLDSIEGSNVTARCGVATIPETSDAECLIKDADQALYRAKNQGRNQVCCAIKKAARAIELDEKARIPL